MATPTPVLTVEIAGRRWRVDAQGHDISIPLAVRRSAADVLRRAARRCSGSRCRRLVRRRRAARRQLQLLDLHVDAALQRHAHRVRRARDSGAPERSRSAVANISAPRSSSPSQPTTADHARRARRGSRCRTSCHHYRALVVRTLPNTRDKLQRNYDRAPAAVLRRRSHALDRRQRHHRARRRPAFSRSRRRCRHLTAHRIFWGLPPGATTRGTGHAAERHGHGAGVHRRFHRRRAVSVESAGRAVRCRCSPEPPDPAAADAVMNFSPERSFAEQQDRADPLAKLRDEFRIPPRGGRHRAASISAAIRSACSRRRSAAFVQEELDSWAQPRRRRPFRVAASVADLSRTLRAFARAPGRRAAARSRRDEHADGEPAPDARDLLSPDARAREDPDREACVLVGSLCGRIADPAARLRPDRRVARNRTPRPARKPCAPRTSVRSSSAKARRSRQ